jgi:two-component system, sensor histidine kinase and response regulator
MTVRAGGADAEDTLGRPPNLKDIRTLVIDDEFTVRAVLRKTLVDWGADVAEADAGARGIAELTRARDAGLPFQLIFVDATMGLTDGFEVVERLKPYTEEFRRAVLMIGPEHMTEQIPRARALSAVYVAKPLTRTAIIGAITNVLGIHDEEGEPAVKSGERRRLRVLLAEDTADVSWILRTLIEGPDYQVDVAQDGRMAADLYRLADYDLVLMDLQMPNFDGYWATRQIRAWERENRRKRTPIIAVTAFAQQEDPKKSFAAGLDGYLVKPVFKDALLRMINKLLRPPTSPKAGTNS